jgi:hypothetical protein
MQSVLYQMTLSAFSYHDCTFLNKRNQHFSNFSGSLQRTLFNLYFEQISAKPKQHLTMTAHPLPQPRGKKCPWLNDFFFQKWCLYFGADPRRTATCFLTAGFPKSELFPSEWHHRTYPARFSVFQKFRTFSLSSITHLRIPANKKSGRLPDHNPQRKRLPLTEIAAVQPSGNHIKKPTPLWTTHSRGVRSDSAAL